MIIPKVAEINQTRIFFSHYKWKIAEHSNGSVISWKLGINRFQPDFRTRCRTINIQNRIRQLRNADE